MTLSSVSPDNTPKFSSRFDHRAQCDLPKLREEVRQKVYGDEKKRLKKILVEEHGRYAKIWKNFSEHTS